MKKQPQRISFSQFRELVIDKGSDVDFFPYLGKGYAMTLKIKDMVSKIFEKDLPLRLDDMRIGYIKSGDADMIINLIPHRMEKGMLMYLGGDSIIQLERHSDDFDIEGFTVTDDVMNVFLHGHVPSLMTSKMNDVRLKPTEEEVELFERLLRMMWTIVHFAGDDDNGLVGDIVSALIHYYDYLYKKYTSTEGQMKSREREIFDKFIRLVNHSNGENRQLVYFADKMYLSERYLSTVVKQASGVTAKEWIDRATVTEIKVLLKHTDKQISQIADQLNFPNDSFFCKYFKRLTGMTPKEYRDGNG